MRNRTFKHHRIPVPPSRLARTLVSLRHRRGTVLPAVLVVIALLALAGYQYADLMTTEFRASMKTQRSLQAKALADSGVHYVGALLSDPQNMSGLLNHNPFSNDQYFHHNTVQGYSLPGNQQGYFSVVAAVDPNDTSAMGQLFRYGVLDESGKINLNSLFKIDKTGQYGYTVLMLLPGMTDDIANSILFWLDPKATPRSSGAMADYYSGLTPSYQPRNGSIDTLEELLGVRGVTPQLLFGGDKNRNGFLDSDEQDPSGNGNQLGWSAYLTIYSREQNIDSNGNPRIYLNNADLNALLNDLTTAIGQDMANFIIAYRTYGPASSSSVPKTGSTSPSGPSKGFSGKAPAGGASQGGATTGSSTQVSATQGTGGSTQGNAMTGSASSSTAQMGTKLTTITIQPGGGSGGGGGGGGGGKGGGSNISSIFDLINCYVSIPSSDGKSPATVYPSPLNDVGTLAQVLPLLLDTCTTNKGSVLPGRININTAPMSVLQTLPGLSDSDVATIMQMRPTPENGNLGQDQYKTIAWLITVAGYSPSAIKGIEKYITASSQVFRFQVVGYFDNGGPMARVEAVVDTNNGRPRIVYYRDLTELGKGFDIPTGSGP
jgi:type II secretory pathway component PulK